MISTRHRAEVKQVDLQRVCLFWVGVVLSCLDKPCGVAASARVATTLVTLPRQWGCWDGWRGDAEKGKGKEPAQKAHAPNTYHKQGKSRS